MLRVAAVVAVTAARVAVVSAAASHPEEGPAPVEPVALPVEPSRCVELRPGVDAPPGARAVQCGGRVLVQDEETGRWREVGAE